MKYYFRVSVNNVELFSTFSRQRFSQMLINSGNSISRTIFCNSLNNKKHVVSQRRFKQKQQQQKQRWKGGGEYSEFVIQACARKRARVVVNEQNKRFDLSRDSNPSQRSQTGMVRKKRINEIRVMCHNGRGRKIKRGAFVWFEN